MANEGDPIPSWAPIPDGDARGIVDECRRCFEEEADRLSPEVRFRMLAIQQAMEAASYGRTAFDLEAVFGQFARIAAGGKDIPAAVAEAAAKAGRLIKPISFFNTYISGKSDDIRDRRFNVYVRSACRRLGLDYEAVIARSGQGEQVKYRLKRARRQASPVEPLDARSRAKVETLVELLARGAEQMAKQGWATDDVGNTYTEARRVEETLDGEDQPAIARLRFDIGVGLLSHYLVRAEFEAARNEVARLAGLASRAGDFSMRVVALRASGTNAFWLGRFLDAERDLRKCLDDLGDGSEYRPFATDLGAPPLSLVSSDLADTLWALGRYAEALEMIQRARARAVAARHPFQDCYTLSFSCWIHLKLGMLDAAAGDASHLCERAHAYGLHALRAIGKTFAGIIEAARADDPRDGLADMLQGLGAWQGGDSALLVCYFQVEAANIWLRSGDVRHAEIELDKAFQAARKIDDAYYASEMYRLRGDIKRLRNQDFAGAETDLFKAMEIATARQSPTFQLRAAMSLLRLAQTRDDLSADDKKRQVARYRKRLTAIRRSFDGQPESADLAAARDLLGVGVDPGRA